MTTPAAPIKYETPKGRFKGSLTGTLVRTLLIFTFIPLALMAGVAYFRARTLLREQAISQAGGLLENQAKIVTSEVEAKESKLRQQIEGDDTALLFETALHANPQSDQFNSIRTRFSKELLLEQGAANRLVSFDAYLLTDNNGNIKLASNEGWQGQSIDPTLLASTTDRSLLLNKLSPLYENKFILLTIVKYQTIRGSTLGALIGITETANLGVVLQPLSALTPYAKTYFILADSQIIASNSSSEFQQISTDPSVEESIHSELDALKNNAGPKPTPINITLQGKAYLGQLTWIPVLQSGVLLAIESSNVYSQINSLAPFTIFLMFLTALAMGAVIYYSTKRVIQPLQTLTKITRRFADGDWKQRAEVTNANEIGELSNSFNILAAQIEDNYKLLEQKVEERALQIRTAAEVAQSITSNSNLDDLLNKTAELLVAQFHFYQASVFMVDRGGKFVEFRTGYGPATNGLRERKYNLPIGSISIVGWVAANNQPRVVSDITEDELHLKNELLPETLSEACVPIALGASVLGVLDVQSTQSNAFSADTIVMLQTLASQIATAAQTAGLIEASQINFQELDRLYKSSRLIAEAKDENEILRISGQILKGSPYPVVLFKLKGDVLKIIALSDAIKEEIPVNGQLMNGIQVNAQEIEKYLSRGSTQASNSSIDIPKAFKDTLWMLDLGNTTLLPVKGETSLEAVVLVGSKQQSQTNVMVQPYESLADLMSIAIQRSNAITQTEKHLQEVESLVSINELVSSISDIQGFFRGLLGKIQQIIGDYSLVVAIYNEAENSIHIPFGYEKGTIQSIPPFPLGEGLTSILIRTHQPLLLVKDTERRAAELGAKIVGKPARSWMGAPMILQGVPLGALIIQDPDNEGAFDEDDLKFFISIASQVAGVIKNAQLLEESKQKAVQLETAAEIARDVSTSLNLDELLSKAVNLIRERFNFYHAGIFLLDLPGEFAIIREATGEAGAQMKRQGYKIGVGSKSIVGFVSGKGEPLIVSDTTKDLTYYPNPLLPDTRAEAALPLRVGDRILGVLDVQSTLPYSFHEDNLRSLQILADQLAVAVANTELFAETQEHLSQHRLLHHITSSAASGTTLEEALESAVNGLQVTLGGDRVTILLMDRDKRALEVKASVGYSENISNMKIEVGSGVTGWVAAHRRPLRVRDVREDSRYIETSPNTRSELAIPLIYRNEILGVINVESEQSDAYSENDEEMLGTLGGSLAAVIANARLLEQIRAQSERERMINEITAKIRRSTDIQSILHTTASEITRITGARYTKIFVEPKNDNDSSGKENA